MPYTFDHYETLASLASASQPKPAPLIGLIGRARAGKDTFAARLIEAHGFTRYAFADALRGVALDLDPIVLPIDTVQGSARLSEIVERVGWEGAKEYREVRRTLQRLGVAVRTLDEEFWVSRVMLKISANAKPAVVTDVRFANEAAAIVAAGGRLVRIVRAGQDESDTHISETALADYPTHAHIDNDSDIATLRTRADAALSSLN
ncbi:hypothetical protein ACPXB5_11360 [Micromonospora arida]|uniref:deoxynucleotide monophosphate kinase family protein n=1 Tax=Micromonospora arida TaxID=2203715 RepID=UPI003CF04B38